MALVEHHDGQAHRHRVRDVSAGGLRIDTATELKSGETVSVSVGALRDLAATVQWVRAGCAGLALAAPIDPDDARKKAAPPAPPRARLAPVSGRASDPVPKMLVPSAGWIDDLRNAYRR